MWHPRLYSINFYWENHTELHTGVGRVGYGSAPVIRKVSSTENLILKGP